MNRKLIILPFIVVIFLSTLPYANSQTANSIISMNGNGWTLKVDSEIQTPQILTDIQVTAKSATERELSIVINDIKEVPEFTAKFKVDTTGLTLYKQLPLTAELNASEYDLLNATHAIKNGVVKTYRPENVLNSYACFDNEGRKVAHIYGSKLIDAKGAYIWVDQELKDGILTVMLDSKWMEQATYPVTLDPSFGYTSVGETNENSVVEARTTGSGFSPTTNGSITDIHVYAQATSGSGIYTLKAALYIDVGGGMTTATLVTSGSNVSAPGTSFAWIDIPVTPTDIYSTSTYYFRIMSNESITLKKDTGANQAQYATPLFVDFPPDPHGASSNAGLYDFSVYANYTDSVEPTPTPTATPETSPTATPQPATTTTNIFFSIMIFAIICLNLTVGYLSKGFIVPATIGLISISIAIATLFTTVYAEIVFSPWMQLMLLTLAIFNEFQVIRKVKG